MKSTEDAPRITFRFDSKRLHAAVVSLAEVNHLSMNQTINKLLAEGMNALTASAVKLSLRPARKGK